MWAQLLEEAPQFFGPWNLLLLGTALMHTLLLSYLGALGGFAIGFVLRWPGIGACWASCRCGYWRSAMWKSSGASRSW